jgi:hypothetical protein
MVVGAPLFLMANQILQSALEGIPEHMQHAVLKELKSGYNQELVNAEIHQKRIAKQSEQVHRSIDGIGQLRMRIDPTLYHHWGQKLGYECWRDNGFLREVERDNPEVRVKSGGTRLQFGYAPSNTRFTKKY